MSDEVAELPGEPEETGDGEIEDSQPLPESEDSQDEQPAEPEEKKPKGVQKRLDELTALRREAERDRDYWRELAMQKAKEPKAEPEAPIPTGRPASEDFESYDQYLDALTDWKLEQRDAQNTQAQQQREQQEQKAAQAQTFEQRAQAVRESHPDFDQVVRNPALPVSDAMAEAAYSSEKGPELLYYLGQNPAEAQRIYSLTPYAQAMEMGKIEAQLSRPSKTQSGAPPPIEPISGSGAQQTVDPDRMTVEQWKAWRNKQVRR
jgi:hypothetical protein